MIDYLYQTVYVGAAVPFLNTNRMAYGLIMYIAKLQTYEMAYDDYESLNILKGEFLKGDIKNSKSDNNKIVMRDDRRRMKKKITATINKKNNMPGVQRGIKNVGQAVYIK